QIAQHLARRPVFDEGQCRDQFDDPLWVLILTFVRRKYLDDGLSVVVARALEYQQFRTRIRLQSPAPPEQVITDVAHPDHANARVDPTIEVLHGASPLLIWAIIARRAGTEKTLVLGIRIRNFLRFLVRRRPRSDSQ